MFTRIVDIVRTRFQERGFDRVEVVGGVASRAHQTNFGAGGSNRVAFVPVDDPTDFRAPLFIGEYDCDVNSAKRQLLTMPFAFDVCCAAFDSDDPEDDIANRGACVNLFEAVAQEIHRAYAGQYGWSTYRIDTDRKEGRFGAELVARLVMNIPIFDAPFASATPQGVLASPEEKAP